MAYGNFENSGLNLKESDSDFNEILDGEKRKFEIKGDAAFNPQNEKGHELPADYGDTRITLLVQDPYWIYAFWEFNESTDNRIKELKIKGSFIRMFFSDMDKYYDTEIKIDAGGWYLKIPEANRSYYAEIGVMEENGNFISLARSNSVTIPANKPVPAPRQVEKDSQDLFNMSGGEWLGKTEGSEKNTGWTAAGNIKG